MSNTQSSQCIFIIVNYISMSRNVELVRLETVNTSISTEAELDVKVAAVRLSVEDNWGHPDTKCVGRLQLLGDTDT